MLLTALAVRRSKPNPHRIPKKLVMLLEPAGDDPAWFVVTTENLPGVVSQGKGFSEAVANGLEAISLLLDSLVEDGVEIPKGFSVVTKVLR